MSLKCKDDVFIRYWPCRMRLVRRKEESMDEILGAKLKPEGSFFSLSLSI